MVTPCLHLLHLLYTENIYNNRGARRARSPGGRGVTVIPYVSGVSERIRKDCEKYNEGRPQIRTNPPLTTHQGEGPLHKEKLAGVVYQIHCQCGKVCVVETQRHLKTRVKEHRDACTKRDTYNSAIAEHQWDQ